MIGLFFFAAATLSGPQIEPRMKAAPKPFLAFAKRRAGCDHFAGEEPYDKARAQEIAKAERELRCDRIEADERAIRRTYAKRRDLIELLDATAGVDW
jgi:hypothetical protein